MDTSVRSGLGESGLTTDVCPASENSPRSHGIQVSQSIHHSRTSGPGENGWSLPAPRSQLHDQLLLYECILFYSTLPIAR